MHSLIVKTFLFQAIQFSQTVLLQTIQLSMRIVFVYTQLNVKTILFQTIQFSVRTVSMLKTVSFQTIQFRISTKFSSIWPIDRTLSSTTTLGPKWTWEWCQWKSTPHSPKLLPYQNLTIRLFSDISRILVSVTPLQRCSRYIYIVKYIDCRRKNNCIEST